MTIQIDKIKGVLSHKHKAAEGYGDWKIKSTAEVVNLGYLYNPQAANDDRSISNINWHLSTDVDWEELITQLGGNAVAGGKMKMLGVENWAAPNFGADNSSGFNAAGSGRRGDVDSAVFLFHNLFAQFVTNIFIGNQVLVYNLRYDDAGLTPSYQPYNYGFAVRLVKYETTLTNGQIGSYTGNDGRIYKTICIGGKEWLSENLAETKYYDGSLIPIVTSDASWIALITGAMCAFGNDLANVFKTINSETLVKSHEIVEFVAGENIKLGLINRTLTISSPGGRVISDIAGLQTLLDGFVVGPDFGNDNIVCVFDGVTGKLIKMSNVTIDASGQMRINAVGIGLTSTSDYVGIEAIAMGPDSFAYSGISDHVPMQLANTDTNPVGNRITLVHRGDSAHLVATNGFGLKEQFRLPRLGWDPAHPELSEIPGGEFVCKLTDNTQNAEYSELEWWVQKNGILTKTMWIDGNGNLNVSGSVIAPGNVPTTIVSADNSVAVSPTATGYNLSVKSAELELYADNETELLAAWVIAIASAKAARIYITNNITFTANRQFVQAYGLQGIKIEAIQNRWFIANNYTIDFNNVTLTNIVFRTTGPCYLRVIGGVASFQNCAWIDDAIDTGARKINILVTGAISANTAKIILKTPTHFTQSAGDNTANLIQPLWIKNESDFGIADSARIYIEILEMAAVFEFSRFARVLLTSTVANCPFSVTGDESWFYSPDQALPGSGNIKASANILRTTTVDKFNAARLVTDDTADFSIGMKANGDAVKRSTRSEDWYGIQWDINVSATNCARIGKAELHQELPLQSLMKGCLLSDAGVVNYYLDPLDWTKKADGSASDLSGADGQVMVEIPAHYRKFENFLSLRKCKISQFALPGFTYVQKFYIGAYEATVQRSTSKLCSVVNPAVDYRGGDNNATWDALTKTLLGLPATSISRINFRTYARNRGSVNWNMLTYDAYKSLFWLYFVEYADMNSQSVFNAAKNANGYAQGGLGNGVTDIDGIKWNAFNGYNPFIPCGYSNSLGNYSGEVSFNMPAEYDAVIKTTKANRYRGISNPFGHIWKWIDGVNIEFQSVAAGGLSKLWVCSNPVNFSNVDYVNYTLLGNMARVDGYIKEMMFGEIMPSITGGGSTTYWSDYGYCANIPAAGTEIRGVFFGGIANYGAAAGFGCSSTYYAPSSAIAYFGSRLCFLGV